MLVINDKIISLDILSEAFVCNLDACKGACCWEGDFGATLGPGEKEVLESIKEEIKPFMTEDGVRHMEEHGVSHYYEEAKFEGTPILDNGACIYLNYTKEGIGLCAIEQAERAGVVDFKKPISCHLYPVRVKRDHLTGFDKLEYYRWDICDPACVKGKESQTKVYAFLKEALIRKYGADFYEALEDAAENVSLDE